MKALAFFFFILIFISSCELKEKSVDNNDDHQFIIYQSNPYEIDGINHNKIIDSFISYMKYDFGESLEYLDTTIFPTSSFDSLLIQYEVRAYHENNIDQNITFATLWNGFDQQLYYYINYNPDSLDNKYFRQYQYSSPKDSSWTNLLFGNMFYLINQATDNHEQIGLFLNRLKDSLSIFENCILSENWLPNETTTLKQFALVKYSVLNLIKIYNQTGNINPFVPSYSPIINKKSFDNKHILIPEWQKELSKGSLVIWADRFGAAFSTFVLALTSIPTSWYEACWDAYCEQERARLAWPGFKHFP